MMMIDDDDEDSGVSSHGNNHRQWERNTPTIDGVEIALFFTNVIYHHHYIYIYIYIYYRLQNTDDRRYTVYEGTA